MIENTGMGFTSLPNLHPAVVHFPIALLAIAFAFDTVACVFRRQIWPDRAAATLWVLGAAVAGAAYLTGRQASDGLGLVVPEIEAAIGRHADLAWWTFLGASAFAVLRLGLWWMTRSDDVITRVGARLALLIPAAGIVGLVLLTADRGGALVYQHGVAVAPLAEALRSSRDGGSSASSESRGRLTTHEDGGLAWLPVKGDASVLTDVLDVVTETGGGAVAEDPSSPTTAGIALKVTGRVFLLLPGDFGDVQVTAVLDLSRFDGTVGVIHHYGDAGSFGSFDVGASSSRLLHVRGGERKVLGEGAGATGEVTITVSSIGSHLKGYIGTATVAHGHVSAPPAGRTGLLLDGRGTIQLSELRVAVTKGD